MQLTFVSAFTGSLGKDPDAARVVRSHAMRAYRESQRAEQSNLASLLKSANGADAYRQHRASSSTGGNTQRKAGSLPKKAIGDTPWSSSRTNRQARDRDGIRLDALTLDSRPMYQSALPHIWLAGTMPAKEHNSPIVSSRVATWLTPRGPAMRYAAETIALLELATQTGDSRIMVAAKQRHLRAMKRLRLGLNDPNEDPTGLQAAVQMLMFCEMYRSTSNENQAVQHHISGVAAMFSAYPLAIADSTLNRDVRRFFHISSLMNALETRKALDLDMIYRCSPIHLSSQAGIDKFVWHASLLPSLLELSDRYHESALSQARQSDVDNLLNDALQLERDLTHSLDLHDPEASAREPSTCAGNTLPFDSFLDANVHCFFSICRLLLYECLLDLLQERSQSPGTHTSNLSPHLASVRSEMSIKADECVVCLVRAIPYLQETAGGPTSTAIAISAPLRFLRRWFERVGDQSKLMWCTERENELHVLAPFLNWNSIIISNVFAIMWLTNDNGEQ